jgi:hypothetical protein
MIKRDSKVIGNLKTRVDDIYSRNVVFWIDLVK